MRVKLSPIPGVKAPLKATQGSEAYDIYAPQDVTLLRQSVTSVDTRLFLEGTGYAAFVLSRSGLAARGVWVANAPGLIDGDYDGPLFVILYNSNNHDVTLYRGERIAQLMPTVGELRGDVMVSKAKRCGGLGSTGV